MRIKEINKVRSIEKRVELMIEEKNKLIYLINDELDEMFSQVDLRKPKVVLQYPDINYPDL